MSNSKEILKRILNTGKMDHSFHGEVRVKSELNIHYGSFIKEPRDKIDIT